MIRHSSFFPSNRSELEDAYKASQHAGHWFSPSTMRFFRSRILDVYRVPNLDLWAFVTSERGPSGVRAYSVRTMDATGDIRTIGNGFQGYPTAAQARTGMKQAILAMLASAK